MVSDEIVHSVLKRERGSWHRIPFVGPEPNICYFFSPSLLSEPVYECFRESN